MLVWCEKMGSEYYEDFEKYNFWINEFILLRKVFKKYYGKDIDFMELLYFWKMEEMYVCGSDDIEMMLMNLEESLKSVGKCLDFDFDENVENYYNDIDCDLMINEVNLFNFIYSFSSLMNYIYVMIRKSVFDVNCRFCLLKELFISSMLKLIYLDDFDCEGSLICDKDWLFGIDF